MANKALKTITLATAITTTAAGTANTGNLDSGRKTFQATVSGSGAVTATVKIQVSNDPDNLGWLDLGTITLSGTTTATDGFASEGSWLYMRCNVTAITGTSASVRCVCAGE